MSKDQDAQEKRRWYRGIGVREYIIADPTGQYAGERRLQRWLLQEGDSQLIDVPPMVGLETEIIASTVLPFGLMVRKGKRALLPSRRLPVCVGHCNVYRGLMGRSSYPFTATPVARSGAPSAGIQGGIG